MHGDHGHVQAFDDLLEAAVEAEHVAGAVMRAFGEDADDVAGVELLAGARAGR